MSVEYFPYNTTSPNTKYLTTSIHDKEIFAINNEIVREQLEQLKQKDKLEQARLLEYLLMNYRIDPNRLVPTYDITACLSNFFSNSSDEKTRTIVRDLRYNGVFVISHPGKPGYKLANSYWDITQQFDHYLKYVIPMLQKVKILNSSISERSINGINILENERSFQELRHMLESLK